MQNASADARARQDQVREGGGHARCGDSGACSAPLVEIGGQLVGAPAVLAHVRIGDHAERRRRRWRRGRLREDRLLQRARTAKGCVVVVCPWVIAAIQRIDARPWRGRGVGVARGGVDRRRVDHVVAAKGHRARHRAQDKRRKEAARLEQSRQRTDRRKSRLFRGYRFSRRPPTRAHTPNTPVVGPSPLSALAPPRGRASSRAQHVRAARPRAGLVGVARALGVLPELLEAQGWRSALQWCVCVCVCW